MTPQWIGRRSPRLPSCCCAMTTAKSGNSWRRSVSWSRIKLLESDGSGTRSWGGTDPAAAAASSATSPVSEKTAQALAVLWAAVTSGVASRVLIVAPASLCAVWRREAALWLGAQTNVACVDEKAADAQRHAPALLLRLL